MIFLVNADTHLWDRNVGSHINFPEETLNEFQRTNDRLRKLKQEHKGEKIGVIHLGDVEHRRIIDEGYRLKVHKLLQERYDITEGNVIYLQGDHSLASYGTTTFEYFLGIGLIKKVECIKEDDVNIYFVDRNQKPEDIIKDVDGELNIVCIHQQIQWEDSKMANFGDEWIKLDDNETFKNIQYILAGHIHHPYHFKGKVYGDTKCEVIYPGSPARVKIDENYEQCSWIIIDTKKKTVEQEFYDLPPLKEVFNEIAIEIENTRQKTIIKDIVDELDEYELDSGDIVDLIKKIKAEKEVKEKAIEYIEKGRG